MTLTIKPSPEPLSLGRSGRLRNITARQIAAILGFEANGPDNDGKTKDQWDFTADGVPCGIWDYVGSWRDSVYSTFGPAAIFQQLFPDHYHHGVTA